MDIELATLNQSITLFIELELFHYRKVLNEAVRKIYQNNIIQNIPEIKCTEQQENCCIVDLTFETGRCTKVTAITHLRIISLVS